VSLRVTDPSGVEWMVAREWFGLPKWARWRRSRRTPDTAAVGGDEGIAIIASLMTLLTIVVFVTVLLPLTLLLLGVVVGAIALLARVTNVATWIVRAESADRTLQWRVRGFVRSKRKLHHVARALERGEEEALEGVLARG
jgi:hypothetical protein